GEDEEHGEARDEEAVPQPPPEELHEDTPLEDDEPVVLEGRVLHEVDGPEQLAPRGEGEGQHVVDGEEGPHGDDGHDGRLGRRHSAPPRAPRRRRPAHWFPLEGSGGAPPPDPPTASTGRGAARRTARWLIGSS